MPGDEASCTHGHQVFVACLILLAPLFLFGFAALLWALVRAIVGPSSDPGPEVPPFCCPEAIGTIIMLSNLTVDPCNNFIGYACYKKNKVDRQAIVERALASSVLHPTLQGKLRSPVSDILRMDHESCLASAVGNLFTAEHAVKAVVDLFRRWSGTISPHAVDLIKLVGLLQFRYYIFSVFRADSVRWHERNETLFVIAALAAPHILAAGTSYPTEFTEVMFDTANSYTGLNVTRAGLTALIARLQAARNVFDENIYTGKFSLLDEAFPNADMFSWKVILRTFPLIGLEDPSNIVGIVEVLVDKDATVQAAALVYFSVHTAWSMFAREITNMDAAASLVARAAFCGEEIVKLFPLWDVLLTQQMTSPERDAVVLQLFHRVADAVLADAQVTFSAYLISSEVRRVVRGLRVVLAVDMTSPYSHHLPDASDNYFENVLEFRDFHFQVRRINAERGLSGLHRLRHNLFQAFVSRAGSHIVISAGVYTLLNFNATRRGNRVNGAAVNNAAVLGVLLADALWDALIDRKNWDFKTGRKVFFRAYCMRDILGRDLAPDLKHALLSLQSTARAVAAPGWHRRALAFGYYHLSASQVFFVLFVLHHSCQTLDYDDDGLSLSESIRHIGEFCDAFGCASQPQIDWATVCEETSVCEDRRTGLQSHLSRKRGAKAVH
ncbi:uncharacterized protein [Dermacentor albipictus]|uniref:uncharacterized protein isoform X2 n=1 Tax=Dermacentor albipictus TaxID=60249 RepID=UPI0038FD00C3